MQEAGFGDKAINGSSEDTLIAPLGDERDRGSEDAQRSRHQYSVTEDLSNGIPPALTSAMEPQCPEERALIPAPPTINERDQATMLVVPHLFRTRCDDPLLRLSAGGCGPRRQLLQGAAT